MSSLPQLQQQLLPKIESELKASFEGHDFSHTPNLKEMLAYHLGWSTEEGMGYHGKRIRPLITLLVAGALKAPIDIALPAAISIEFLHNFTLIHDDIEDKSTIRHGRSTLWCKWGIPQAINAGDALFTIAQIAMLDLTKATSESITNEAIMQLNRICLHLTQGQHLDIAFETENEIEISAYLRMISGKTAALLALSAFLGGLVAHQGLVELALLSDYGTNLGLAFQIQDDYLGIWGDTEKIGKSTAGDISSRKKTLPILYGLKNCPEFIEAWQKQSPLDQNVALMANILSDCGAQSHTHSQAQYYTKKAFEALTRLFSQNNEYANALFELTEMLLHRNT
jgi:geranylgeranyl diphosphate synthase type I